MDRRTLAQARERALKHVHDGDEIIARQEVLIAKREAHGLDVGVYREVLALLEATHHLQLEHLQTLKELDQALGQRQARLPFI